MAFKSKLKIESHLICAIFILCIGAFFLFYNLGSHHHLWKDEAETALLARSVLETGLPIRNIGQNQIQLHVPQFLRNGEIWTFHPWLQFYVTALSFKIFGEGSDTHLTWAARFPFAVFGFLSLILTYVLALRLSHNRTVALLSLLLLTFSIPFILNMRECRYYAPGVFFSLLLCWFYLDFLDQKKRAFFGFLVTANLLFHTSYGYFIPMNVGILVHYLIYYFKGRRNDVLGSAPALIPFVLLQSLVFLTTFPTFIYYNGFQHGSRGFDLNRVSHNLQYYFRVIYKFMFPLFLIVGVMLLDLFLWKKKIWNQWKQYLSKQTFGFILILTCSALFFGALGDQHYYRYILYLVPLFLILTASFFVTTFLYSKWIAQIGFVLVIFTSLLHYSVFNIFLEKKISYVPPLDYVLELVRPYDDLSRGMVEFFKKNANPNDTIGISYADHQLMFYTHFKVININFEKYQFPDWIVYQRGWFEDVYENIKESDYFKTIQAQYERIETNIPDVRWSYRPDPYWHNFQSFSHFPRLVIFRKKS